MKRIVSLILVVILCLALSVGAFAASSNQGGANGSTGAEKSPKTGTVAVAALAVTACTAGGISILAGTKSKK